MLFVVEIHLSASGIDANKNYLYRDIDREIVDGIQIAVLSNVREFASRACAHKTLDMLVH